MGRGRAVLCRLSCADYPVRCDDDRPSRRSRSPSSSPRAAKRPSSSPGPRTCSRWAPAPTSARARATPPLADGRPPRPHATGCEGRGRRQEDDQQLAAGDSPRHERRADGRRGRRQVGHGAPAHRGLLGPALQVTSTALTQQKTLRPRGRCTVTPTCSPFCWPSAAGTPRRARRPSGTAAPTSWGTPWVRRHAVASNVRAFYARTLCVCACVSWGCIFHSFAWGPDRRRRSLARSTAHPSCTQLHSYTATQSMAWLGALDVGDWPRV